jgi:nucleoside-diphosphate-sugar epimerase
MRAGKKIVVHGDGSSLWVLTHNSDFARGFLPLLGNEKAVGQAFHITSDRVLTWNQIYQLAAVAAGTEANIVHIPSAVIAKYDFEWGCDLLGQDGQHDLRQFQNKTIRARFFGGYSFL